MEAEQGLRQILFSMFLLFCFPLFSMFFPAIPLLVQNAWEAAGFCVALPPLACKTFDSPDLWGQSHAVRRLPSDLGLCIPPGSPAAALVWGGQLSFLTQPGRWGLRAQQPRALQLHKAPALHILAVRWGTGLGDAFWAPCGEVRWGEVRNGAEGWFLGRSGTPSGRSSCGSGRSLWEQHGSAGRPGWCRWRARVWRGGFYFEMQTWNKKHKTRALCRPCTTPSVLRASKMTRNTTTATVKYAGKKNNFWPWNCVLNKLPQSESGGFSWQHLEGKQKEEGGCTRLHLGLAPGLRRRRAGAPPGDFIHI